MNAGCAYEMNVSVAYLLLRVFQIDVKDEHRTEECAELEGDLEAIQDFEHPVDQQSPGLG